MTGRPLLDWAVLAISLGNSILLLWLGLTVVLNAERRTWGIWLAGGGLLMAAAFLSIHAAIFAGGWARISQGLNLAWLIGLLLVVALPFSWYLLMLWYAGYWDDATSPLRRRQQPWLGLTGLVTVGLVLLLLFANPLPSYLQIVDYETGATPGPINIPLASLVYPAFILLCISLSIDVLRWPVPSGRIMGDLARRRARPWLIATSLALLVVSGLVALAIAWIMLESGQLVAADPFARMAAAVAWFSLIIGSVLAVAILLLGQAIASYEIFTGKSLPRRGLRWHWRSMAAVATGLGVLGGGGLSGQIDPLSSLLLGGALVTLVFALWGRQSFAERERYIEHLRPHVASLHLYERLLVRAIGDPPGLEVATLFGALVADVLGARVAYLAALGPLAPLAGPPVSYPADAPLPAALPSLEVGPGLPATLCVPLGPEQYGGARWAVPLSSAQGPIGVLLLGDKSDGSLYTQEEIEIARASGERLIDTRAGAEMAWRLMALQRQRLAENQVLDRQARRVLHDDVLPRLHAAALHLSQTEGTAAEGLSLLAEAHRQIFDLLREMPAGTAPELARLGLIGALRWVAGDELASAFDDMTWEIELEAEVQAPAIPLRIAEVVFYAAREVLRNAARHGRGAGQGRPLHLRVAVTWRDGLMIRIEDSGVGLGPGKHPSEGNSRGLALHSTMMAVIGGSLSIESLPGAYTRVYLFLPRLSW